MNEAKRDLEIEVKNKGINNHVLSFYSLSLIIKQ